MAQTTENKNFIPALTGFRAIAAWMIFVLHFFPKNSHFPDIIKKMVGELHIGVDMFFVLSGFLITYRYFNQNPINFKKYIINRFSRIYPMYFLITTGTFIAFYFQYHTWDNEKTTEAILSYTMLKALFSKYLLKAGISQGWTLTLEELFYLTAPFYFILIRKKKTWLYLLPILIFIFGSGLKYLFNTPQNTWSFMQENISLYIFEFFAGITLALFIKKRNKIYLKYNIVTYIGIFFILAYLIFNPLGFRNPDYIMALQRIILSFFGILPLLWGLIFEDTFIKRLLSTPFMIIMGKSSYIFYLIHKGFIPMLIWDHIAENVLIIFIILNVLSIILFHYVEEPLNNFIRKTFAK